MEIPYALNLSYKSPMEAVATSHTMSPSGTIDIRTTLIRLKALLESNVRTLDSLLESAVDIGDFIPVAQEHIFIEANQETLDRIVRSGAENAIVGD